MLTFMSQSCANFDYWQIFASVLGVAFREQIVELSHMVLLGDIPNESECFA